MAFPLNRTPVAAIAALCLTATVAVGVSSCKKPGPTCDPDEHEFETIRIVVGPSDDINLDPDGKARATVLKVFQLTDDRILDTVTFEDIWKDAAGSFGELLVDEQEYVVYPEKPEVHELKPNPDAKFVVAAAIFREPVGNTWVTSWDVPQFHGHSVCSANKAKKPIGDPCFYVGVERNEIDGGHKPPVIFHGKGLADLVCPGEPLMVQPPEEKSDKEKKKEARKKKRKERREKMKGKAEDAQGKAEEGKAANDKADAGADAATTKPEGPSVPGKD